MDKKNVKINQALKSHFDTFMQRVEHKLNELNKNLENKLNEKLTILEERLKNEIASKISNFSESIEQVIDMTAALTTELTSQLDEVKEQLNNFIEEKDVQESNFEKFTHEIRRILDKLSMIFDTKMDGLRRQIDEDVKSRLEDIYKLIDDNNRSTIKK